MRMAAALPLLLLLAPTASAAESDQVRACEAVRTGFPDLAMYEVARPAQNGRHVVIVAQREHDAADLYLLDCYFLDTAAAVPELILIQITTRQGGTLDGNLDRANEIIREHFNP